MQTYLSVQYRSVRIIVTASVAAFLVSQDAAMARSSANGFMKAGSIAMVFAAAGAVAFSAIPSKDGKAGNAPQAAPQAVPVSVAVVEKRQISTWEEFSGRLEAVERV